MRDAVQSATRRNYRAHPPEPTANVNSDRVLPFKTVCADDITLKPTDYLLKGLINTGELGVWYGPSGGGKTFEVLDVAHAVATGRSILGRRVRRTQVLICALEGAAGFDKRIIGVVRERGAAPDLHVYAGPLCLHQNGDMVARLIATIKRVGARLVVIDTLSRSMPGADESSATDMTGMIAVFGKIIHETGAHVLIVHHTGKDEARGSRGHSSLKAAADVEIEITKNGGGHTLRTTKVKDGPCDVEYAFTLRKIELGKDEDDDTITTCVVDEGGQRAGTPKASKITKGDRQALDWLREAVNEYGGQPPFELPSGMRVVTKDKWAVIAKMRSDKTDEAVRKAIDRAVTNLTVAKIIGVHAPYFWVI